MKFNEFVALDAKLKDEGTSINEIVKGVTGEYLFEEELMEKKPAEVDALDTSGDKLKRLTSPRFAKARRKLTNNAKNFRDTAKEKIIAKFMPKILDSIKGITNKAVALSADGRNPKEINKVLGKEAKHVVQLQDKAIAHVEGQIQKLEAVFQKRIDEIMKNDKLSDKSKQKLEMYWTLLSTQFTQQLSKYMVKYREDFIEETAKNNPDLVKIIDALSGGENLNLKIQKLQDQANQEQKDYETEKKEAEGTKEDVEPEIGKTYQWTTTKGKVTKAEVIEKNPEGKWMLKFPSKKDPMPAGQKAINDRLGKEVKAETEA